MQRSLDRRRREQRADAAATIIQPESEACRSAGYQVAIALSGAIRPTDTPAPISARPSPRPASVSLRAKHNAPQAPIESSTGSTRRGPKRSSSMPAGICMLAKATKYALVSSPSDDGDSPSVVVSSGEMTALTLRNRHDSKYAQAKLTYSRANDGAVMRGT